MVLLTRSNKRLAFTLHPSPLTWVWVAGFLLVSSFAQASYTPVTVEESDGTPSVKEVAKIKVSNGVLTDDGSGEVTLAISSGSGTVNTGALGYFAYYPGNGTTVDDQTALFTNGTNVGIGTSNPTKLLEVSQGDILVTDSTAAQWAEILFTNDVPNTMSVGLNGSASGGTGYVYTAAAIPIGIWTSNAERLRVAADGNVGIGATTVSAQLHVQETTTTGNTAVEGMRLSHIDSNTAGSTGIGVSQTFYLESDSAGVTAEAARIEAVLTDAGDASKDSVLRFYTLGPDAGAGSNAATEKLSLDSTGLLTLGAAGTDGSLKFYNELGATDRSVTLIPSASQTADYTLTLPTAAAASNGQVLTSQTDGSLSWTTPSTGSGTVNAGLTGYLAYYPGDGTTVDDLTLLYTNGANIGIGTTTPSFLLEVHGEGAGQDVEIEVESTSTTGFSGILFRADGANNFSQLFRNGSAVAGSGGNNAFNIWQSATAPIIITTANSERMRVAGDGNVGIGATNPAALLHAQKSSTTGNTVLEAARLAHIDSNTAGSTGIGVSQTFYLESDSAGVMAEAARIETALTDSGDASKDSILRFYTLGPDAGAGSNAATEKLSIDSTGLTTLGAAGTDGSLKFYNELGATDYDVTIIPSASQTASYSLTLPTAQASGTKFLQNNGSGVLSWADGTASTTLQDAYTNDASGAADITLTDAKDIEITLPDTATDPNFEITTAGAGVFRFNDDGTFTDSTPFIITSTGNVGVGIAAPASLFVVEKSGGGAALSVNEFGNVTIGASFQDADSIYGNSGVFRVQSTGSFGWSASQAYNASDTALFRNAAGVVEINNGTAGQYRDLQLRAINPASGNVGIGTTTVDRKLHVEEDNASNTAVTYLGRLTHTTSGVPGAGIGAGLEFEAETAADNFEIGSAMEAVLTDDTATNEDFALVFKAMTAGAAATEKLRIDSTGLTTLGAAGTDGSLKFYNELGATDRSVTLIPSASQTADYTLTLPTAAAASNGQVLTSQTDGSLSWTTPSTGSGTVNTGVQGYFGYYPANGTTVDDQTVLFTNGTNVGIGTTVPGEFLHVYKNADASLSLLIENASASGSAGEVALRLKTRSSDFDVYSDDNINRWGVWDNNASAFRQVIDANGNVGIGTDTPGSLLALYGATPVMDIETSDAAIIAGDDLGTIQFRALDAGQTHLVGAMIRAEASAIWDGSDVDYAPTDLQFFTEDATINDNLATPRMTITSTGNVGIGTTDPGDTLYVYSPTTFGGVRIKGVGDSTDFSKLILESDEATDKLWSLGHIKSAGSINDLAFWRYNGSTWAQVLTLEMAGNVAIGTDTPVSLLTVQGVQSLFETTAPSLTASYGKLYVKSSDSNLYFMNDSGAETNLSTGSGAPVGASYITQTPDGTLSGEQALSALATGLMQVTTTTGVVSSVTTSAGVAGLLSDEVGSSGGGVVVFSNAPTITSPIIKGEAVVALTDAATIATDASLGNIFTVSSAVNRTLGVPSNPTSGQKCIWRWTNSDVSAHTLTLTTGSAGAFRFGTTVQGTSATPAGKTDYIGAVYNATADRWDVIAYAKGYV